MSELSDKIRSEFKKADDERDALMNTPEDIERWDNIVYGHDDREMQRLDVYRPKQAQGEDLPIIISVHGGAWMPVLLYESCTARICSCKLYISSGS